MTTPSEDIQPTLVKDAEEIEENNNPEQIHWNTSYVYAGIIATEIVLLLLIIVTFVNEEGTRETMLGAEIFGFCLLIGLMMLICYQQRKSKAKIVSDNL